jgi:hypothetical protein
MPACWVISPIVVEGGVNMAKVAALRDAGGELRYGTVSAIYPERGMAWCLSYVSGDDFGAIDDDPDCERVFVEALPDQAGKRPAKAEHLAWLDERPTGSTAKATALLTEKGIDAAGLSAASTRKDWLARLGRGASAGLDDFNPGAWYTP